MHVSCHRTGETSRGSKAGPEIAPAVSGCSCPRPKQSGAFGPTGHDDVADGVAHRLELGDIGVSVIPRLGFGGGYLVRWWARSLGRWQPGEELAEHVEGRSAGRGVAAWASPLRAL